MLEEMGVPVLSQMQAGLLFLSLGLAVGSFCSVIWHRVPVGLSILRPRSHCLHCRYQLRAVDLVPVLSFLWLGGRCRKCRTFTGWNYLAWELGAGSSAMAAGYFGGWTAGLVSLASWVVGAAFMALLNRTRLRRASQAGFTLVEVLVSFGLLVLTLAPLLNVFSAAWNSALVGEKRTIQVALARARLSQIANDAFSLPSTTPLAPTCAAAHGVQTGDVILGEPSLGAYEVDTSVSSVGGQSCEVRVTVTCPTCRSSFGLPLRSYSAQSVIRKKTNGGG